MTSANQKPENNRITKLRVLINKNFKVAEFKYKVVLRKFGYKVGSRITSEQTREFSGNFHPEPAFNENGKLSMITDEYHLLTYYTYMNIIGDSSSRSGRVTYYIYHKDVLVDTVKAHWYFSKEKRISKWDIALTLGVNGRTPETSREQKIKTETTCPHTKDGAIEVAKYIADEIKRNVKGNTAKIIRDQIESQPMYVGQIDVNEASYTNALAVWAAKVRTNGDWDHKPKIRGNPDLKSKTVHRLTPKGMCSRSHYHKYKDCDYFLDVWSNIHYGYVGLSVGFSKQILLSGSNLQQWTQAGTDKGDTLDDITAIKIGFSLYEKFDIFAEKLTYQHILDALNNTPREQLSESKLPHACIDKRFCEE